MNKYFNLTSILSIIASSLLVITNATAFTPPPGNNGDPASAYANTGSQSVSRQSLGNSCTLYRPSSLTSNHAVIVWGNGTGTLPSSYSRLLRHWASWGFVVVAANTSNAGSGSEMIDCLDRVYNSLGSQLSDQVATTGHSQGGGGSVMAGTDRRVDATAPIQPNASGFGVRSSSFGQQNGPMLLLSGSADTVVAPSLHQRPIYNGANVPVFWATRRGAGHMEPTYDGGDFRGITTAWFLYQLQGDTETASLFEGANCGFCTASGWDVQRKGF